MIFEENIHSLSIYIYHLSTYLSILLSIYLYIYIYILLSIYLFIYLGSGIITKEDEVEGVCQEIRLAVGRTSLIQVIQYAQYTYTRLIQVIQYAQYSYTRLIQVIQYAQYSYTPLIQKPQYIQNLLITKWANNL